jgi:hypothetical protein
LQGNSSSRGRAHCGASSSTSSSRAARTPCKDTLQKKVDSDQTTLTFWLRQDSG